jgi:hypothetical protein
MGEEASSSGELWELGRIIRDNGFEDPLEAEPRIIKQNSKVKMRQVS